MISPCVLHLLPSRRDERGALAYAETGKQLPFEVRREFHLFDLRPGVARGGHAHKACHQFLIAMAGSFSVTTDNGTKKFEWELDSPDQGLHVPPGHWVELTPNSSLAVLSVLASHPYEESDYIRSKDAFIESTHGE
jgi:dTDP-4-dehydrorhamnose 3,5-epimerase-like enzyme